MLLRSEAETDVQISAPVLSVLLCDDAPESVLLETELIVFPARG